MFKEIMPKIYVFFSPNQGSNSYLLAGEKLVLIDTGLGETAPLLEDSLQKLGFSLGDVALIWHTHGHADHFSADFPFAKAEVKMHEFDAEYVNSGDSAFTCSHLFQPSELPKITGFLKHGQEISIKPFSIKVLLTPGHTKGSVCFYEENLKVLFSGDTLFEGNCGRFDLASGSIDELIDSLEMLSKLEIELLLPGHGPALKGAEANQKNLSAVLENLKSSQSGGFI